MTAYTDDLYLGAQEAHQALWPGQKTPTNLLWPEVMAPFLLLDPALPKPMCPLPQLLLPAALLPLLPLKLCSKNTFKFHQIPDMPGVVVRYTLLPLVCYLNKFYFGLLAY
jgi:hypothetical protein